MTAVTSSFRYESHTRRLVESERGVSCTRMGNEEVQRVEELRSCMCRPWCGSVWFRSMFELPTRPLGSSAVAVRLWVVVGGKSEQ